MCSFDVTSLYPSIPLQEVYPIVEELLLKNNYTLIVARKIVRLLR